MTDMKKAMDYAEERIMHIYNRFPVVLDHGRGVYLYDVEGKKYLDFAAGIAVCALGYGNEEYSNAVKAQVDKLIHVSNLYYTEPMSLAAHNLTDATGLEKVFFTNSGTEAVEGAIKLARKYAYTRDNKSTDHEIIAMNNSFHGRSIGALSVLFRTQSPALIDGMTDFFRLWKSIEDAHLSPMLNAKVEYALYDGKFVRTITVPDRNCTSDELASSLAEYIRLFDKMMKGWLTGRYDAHAIEAAYYSYLTNSGIHF